MNTNSKSQGALVQTKISLTPEVLEEIERDEQRMRISLGWEKSEFSLLGMIQQGLIEITGRQNGELIYNATPKGKSFLRQHGCE